MKGSRFAPSTLSVTPTLDSKRTYPHVSSARPAGFTPQ